MQKNVKLQLVPVRADPVLLAKRIAEDVSVTSRDATEIRRNQDFRVLVTLMRYNEPREEHFATMIARGGLDILPEILSYLRKYPVCIRKGS